MPRTFVSPLPHERTSVDPTSKSSAYGLMISRLKTNSKPVETSITRYMYARTDNYGVYNIVLLYYCDTRRITRTCTESAHSVSQRAYRENLNFFLYFKSSIKNLYFWQTHTDDVGPSTVRCD